MYDFIVLFFFKKSVQWLHFLGTHTLCLFSCVGKRQVLPLVKLTPILEQQPASGAAEFSKEYMKPAHGA